jgi:hypothetical protein
MWPAVAVYTRWYLGAVHKNAASWGPFTHAAIQPGEEEELVVDKPDEAAACHTVRDGAAIRVHRVQKIVVPQL